MSIASEEPEDIEEVDVNPKTKWVKFRKIRNIFLINFKKSKQYVAISGGCHIVFLDPETEEEMIFRAVNEERGEGVQCMDFSRKSKIFAFAEKCMNPRIMIFSFPDFVCLNSLKGGSINGYLSITFSDKEYLVSLGTYPEFLIIVWDWKTGVKMAVKETIFHEENQILKCNLGSGFFVCQMPKHSNTLSIWSVHVCYTLCRLIREDVSLNLAPGSRMCDCLWSPDGMLYILESFGDVYVVDGEQRVSLAIKWEEIKGHCSPCMAWHKNGIIISGPNGVLKHYTVVSRRRGSVTTSALSWKVIWTAQPKYPFREFCSSDLLGVSELFGMTVRGELYSLTENSLTQVKNYGSGIKNFNFVYSHDNYVVTLNNDGNLLVWTSETGSMVAGMPLGSDCHNMHASPAAPILAVSRTDGCVLLVSLEKPTEPIIAATIPLCFTDIGILAFTSSGKHLLAGAKQTGHIFVLKAPPRKNIFVMCYIKLQARIADATIFEEEEKVVRVAFIIKTLNCCGKGGNEIYIYKSRIHSSAEMTKPLKLEHIIRTGFSYVCISHNHIVPEQLCAIPHRSRHIHIFVMEKEEEDGVLVMKPKLTTALASGHQIRGVQLRFSSNMMVSWGADGLVVLRCASTLRPLVAVAEHHRVDGGVLRARVHPDGATLLSLGCDGALVATDLRATHSESGSTSDENTGKETLKTDGKIKGKDSIPATKEREDETVKEYILIGADKKMNWLQKRMDMKDKEDRFQQGGKRKNFQKLLSDIKRQTIALLEANLWGPEEEKLPTGDFDLDEETRQKKIENFNEVTADMIMRIKAEISARDALTTKIKVHTWDKMVVKSQQIHAFLEQFFVENYALTKPDADLQKRLNIFEDRMKLTWNLSKADCFYPWIPNVSYDMVREEPTDLKQKRMSSLAESSEADEPVRQSSQDDIEVFRGSVSHKYVNVSPYHCSQFELSTFYHVHQEVLLLGKITRDLQEYFNKEFEKILHLKETELSLQVEKNNRRRYLLSELNISGIPVIDVEWNSFEEPERLMIVKEDEVSVPPYLTKSEEELRARKAAEAEALRLALLADDFRERALIVMMHGVLELRWEDKIKKDVPKPKCLLEKNPEEWNEEDIRTIRDYDQKVLNLMDQRRLYRKICGKEYQDILLNQKETMLKFDKRLQQLLLLKMEIQSCIDQETLKILRGRLKIHERLTLEAKEQSVLKEIGDTDEAINDLQKEIHDLFEAKRSCRHEYDALLSRERNFEKVFKKEFRDFHGPVANHLYKLFKRRPKVHQKAQMSVALLEELSWCSVQPGDLPSYLPTDIVDFLAALDALDDHSCAPHGATEGAWNALCKLRRSKIEVELKIKAMALQLAKCDSTINVFNKILTELRDNMLMFNNVLKDIRDEKLATTHNVQIQLVLKQGVVEIADTSDFGDFTDCVLINRSVIEEINSLILEAGNKKLKQMHKVTNFHRVVMCKEWEHKKLRMIIEDLKDKLKYVERARLTRDVQTLLKMKAANIPLDSGKEIMDKHIAAYKQQYDTIIKTTKEDLKKLNRRVRRTKKENFDLDKCIININVDVNELMLKRDAAHSEELDKHNIQRMKLIVLRGKALRKIQQQFHEILLLQTELELLRLKTYPTLKYNALQ